MTDKIPGEKRGISGVFIEDMTKGGLPQETPLTDIESGLSKVPGVSQGVQNLPSQEKGNSKTK